MNAFEQGLAQARARQRRLFVGLLVAFGVVCLGVAAILISASGTSIRVLPADARDSATLEVASGFAFTVENIVYGFAAGPVITVRAEGFREKSLTITPEQQGGTLDVTLEEIPGRLIATTDPGQPNTRWILNGDFLTVAEVLERELEPGSYRLRIDNPFFELEDLTFEVERAQEYELAPQLTPIAGQLDLSSSPDGARVTVDGVFAGETPVRLERSGGSYEITIEKEDFVTVTESVMLTRANPVIERNYRLKPVSATLSFSVEPSGGQLLLNGRQIDPSGAHDVSANSTHRVTYAVDGYSAETREVTLKAREARRVAFKLKPELGDVEIYAGPSAEILVDGKKLGEGSLTLALKALPHRIELRKPGYRSVTRTIRPSKGRKTVVRETLVPEAVARLAEAPRSYRNSVGMELLLFQPGNFVMGAPRHQKGQRANEFLKEVQLKRSFYAARHEVTNGQYARFRTDRAGAADEPVVSVSWIEAASFSNWLSEQEGLSPFYRIENGRLTAVNTQAEGYRLLSEAEWEWLARKAGKPAQTIFPWGDESVVPPLSGNIADESANGVTRFYVANYTDGYAKLAPVGKFKAEASGLYDLTGNVSEWVHDFYSLAPPPAQSVHIDPLGPGFGDTHVIKGASWRSGTRTLLRAAYRDGLADRRDDVGFRIGRYLHGANSAAEN
ncbi:SUMF1/EgtB/PvdO family nonheme iron enzyme [Denitrobaculum tricleocarpae]|uniref:SUMF1/EgtB/PvdOfamily nonheme iron enzyme n=1 Tax=Denitrobaculum tricleocarpae TaxID=2591009 RepID=A0A545TL55_9PROT|nr:SUMF1/EgtB/PvdO family nonheme iron enzyme [Denitrobaculum tricleocarpae]TQV77955.1 SUMF1/EgtB/PvdOfamily nonheme iron enzyme [Denitrobaculum tricleocarpae]